MLRLLVRDGEVFFETANGPVDLSKLREILGDAKGAAGEDLSARANESEKAVEELRVKVQDLERQLSAVKRQLQMQGEVSRLAVSVDDRLREVSQECERRISETEQAVSGDVRQVAALSGELRRAFSEEVSRLREAFGERILAVEQEAHEAVRVLRDEIQPKIKQLDAVTICFPDPLKGNHRVFDARVRRKRPREQGRRGHSEQWL